MKHTPAPWNLHASNDELKVCNILNDQTRVHAINGKGLATIAFAQLSGVEGEPFDTEEGNAAWIVKCVNFIGNDFTEEMLDEMINLKVALLREYNRGMADGLRQIKEMGM